MAISLPYTIANGNDADGDEVGANFDALASGAVPLAGGTMTGALILDGAAPATANTAASKSYVDAANPSTASFLKAANQTINGTTATISFESETTDTDGWWVVGTPSTFTCPANGVYVLVLEAAATGAVASEVSVNLVHGTATRWLGYDTVTTRIPVTYTHGSGGLVVYMNAGETFNVKVGCVGAFTLDNIKLTITKLAAI